MSYKILSATQDGTNIITKTEFILSDGTKRTIQQTHFQPSSTDSVLAGIRNQESAEERHIALPSIIAGVMTELGNLINSQTSE